MRSEIRTGTGTGTGTMVENESEMSSRSSPDPPGDSPSGRRACPPPDTPHRPSSPLRPIGEALSYSPSSSRDYTFAASPKSGLPTATISAAQHRSPLSVRSRRPSQLLQEIQTPSRRLSSHPMLLLIPFGDAVPARALAEGVAQVGTSTTISGRVSGSSGAFSSRSGWNVDLPPTKVHSSSTVPPRVRHVSLVDRPASSSLFSAPMTTIQSVSNHSSSEGVSPSHDGDVSRPALTTPRTVAMTRFNSLPVLTLRELEAMKTKDRQLGIARGGDYAWFPREEHDDNIDESPEVETPGMSADNTASVLSTSLISTSSGTIPPSRFPFTNPFAPRPPPHPATSSMVRETASFTPPIIPVATAPEYRYSPTDEARRMSETPGHQSPTARHLDSSRRPSAPVSRGPIHSSPRSMATSRPPRADYPQGTPLTSPARPLILRYRSSPGHSPGLGFQIVVRGQPPRGPTISGGDSASPSSPRHPGSWMTVDVVDSLAAESCSSSTSSGLLLGELRSSPASRGRKRFVSVDSAFPPFLTLLEKKEGGWSETFPRSSSSAVIGRTPWAWGR